MDECLIKLEDLSIRVKKIFGEDHIIDNINRMYGGTQKGTFKVKCTNGFNFILYIWDTRTTYFSNHQAKSDLFNEGGAKVYAINERVLMENGLPTPKLYHMDNTRKQYLFDYAFVEYIPGKEIKHHIKEGDPSVPSYLKDLSIEIKKLHSIKSKFSGQPEDLYENNFCCEKYILNKLDNDMKYLERNSKDIALGKSEIKDCYMNLYNKIKPRREYVLIHGELGTNHVLIGEDKKIHFIDIERVKYFDIEYEASYIEFRFKDNYKYLKEENLDINRINFYKIYHNISFLSGAIQLKETNYFDKADIDKMIKHNLEEIIKFL